MGYLVDEDGFEIFEVNDQEEELVPEEESIQIIEEVEHQDVSDNHFSTAFAEQREARRKARKARMEAKIEARKQLLKKLKNK